MDQRCQIQLIFQGTRKLIQPIKNESLLQRLIRPFNSRYVIVRFNFG